jgi:hypothetical protein
MTTTTITTNHVQAPPFKVTVSKTYSDSEPYNKAVVGSFALTLLFASYFVVPHVGFFRFLFRSYSVVFIIIIPVVAFALSLFSLFQLDKHLQKGRIMACLVFLLNGAYFLSIFMALCVFAFGYVVFTRFVG